MTKPMPDHEYHAKSDEMLRYIIKDAGRAAEAMRNHDIVAECKYLDQMNDACTILHYRRKLASHNASVLAAIKGHCK